MPELTKKQLRDKNRRDHQEAFASWQRQYDAALKKAIKTGDTQDILAASRLADMHPDTARTVSASILSEQSAVNQAKYVPILKTILGAAGVGASMQQINMANLAKGRLVRPGIPSPPAIDPGVNQQIYNAQLGSMNAGRTAAAANVGINDAYNQAVQEATNTAGGQSGIRQSLINKANLNKMRASIGVLPEIDAVRAREEGRADQLIGQRAQLGQNSYGQLLQATGMGLDQYNRDAEAIAKLGAIGHENLFGQLQSMPENLVAGMSSFSNPYAPKYSEFKSDNSTGDQKTPEGRARQFKAHLSGNLNAHATNNSQYYYPELNQ